MHLPTPVQQIKTSLQAAGFDAYAVGGCVRDMLLKKVPKDWDVTTTASPAEIQKLFPKSFYTNTFGTVTVLAESTDPTLQKIEVTTYRIDSQYSDQRHPDTVTFTSTLEEDLSRRDFTINAIAVQEVGKQARATKNKNEAVIDDLIVIDPFGGMKDLNAGVIRAVGDPNQRFQEDALRLLRAVRLAAQLDFTIEPATLQAMQAQRQRLAKVSAERVQQEIIKLALTDEPEKGCNLLEQTGLLAVILPELQEGVGVGQNKHHIYTVFDHCIKSLQFASQYDYPLHVRLAALFHDIGKPRTKRPQGNDFTFYAHDIVGARMTEKLMKRLQFSTDLTNQVTHLVRHHMFYYDVGKVTEAGLRRLLRRVGPANFDDLIKLRIAERKGSGVPKAEPYRLRHLQFMAEKAAQQPISTSQLAINGSDLMQELQLTPGPRIGGILNALLAEVLDNPLKNDREHLLTRAKELQDKDPAELKAMGEQARDDEQRKQDELIKRKYHV